MKNSGIAWKAYVWAFRRNNHALMALLIGLTDLLNKSARQKYGWRSRLTLIGYALQGGDGHE